MRAVVVGGGIGGLSAAWHLRRAGAEVVCLEQEPAPGGKVRTDREGGYVLEWGPQAFLDEPGSAFRRAIAGLGLEGEVILARREAKKRYLLRRRRPRLMPREVHRILSGAGLLRAAREPFVPGRDPGAAPPESVTEWARRRFGGEAARRLFDPLVSGVFAGDADRLELASAFPRIAELERRYGSVVRAVLRGGFKPRGLATFRTGMGRFPEALAGAIGPALVLGFRAIALERQAAGWRVVAEPASGGERRRFDAGAVVLAVPGAAAAALMAPLDAPLAALTGAIPAADIAALGLGYDERAAFPGSAPVGFGVLAAREEGLVTLGCLYPSSAFEGAAPAGKVLLRPMVGGRRHPEAAALADRDLVALVRRELIDPVLGARIGPELVRIYRHPAGIAQYEIGHAARLAAIDVRLEALPGLHLTGAFYRGISTGDVVADAERVAAALLREPRAGPPRP